MLKNWLCFFFVNTVSIMHLVLETNLESGSNASVFASVAYQ